MEHDIELTAEDLWNDVSARLRDALNDTTYSTWFGEASRERLPGGQVIRAAGGLGERGLEGEQRQDEDQDTSCHAGSNGSKVACRRRA